MLPAALTVLCALCGLSSAAAQVAYEEPSGRDIVVAYNTGFRFGISPGLFIPTGGGDVGFSLSGDLRYGFETGPVILAPGLRLSGYIADPWIFIGMPTFRVTLPLGPVGPYVLGGAGPGYVSEPSEAGLAYMGGGGFMVHFGLRFGLGAEVSYQGISGTDFAALSIGPTLLLAF